MPHYDLQLTKKLYGAKAVRAIATAACDWGYNMGIKDTERVTQQQLDDLKASLHRLDIPRLRLQVAHELLTSLRIVIDP